MKPKVGYKILTRKNKQLHSYIYDASYTIRYLVGKEVRPKKGCGPLAVFKDLKDLKKFLESEFSPHLTYSDNYDFNCLTVYECEYISSREKYLYYSTKSFGRDLQRSLIHLPKGTVLASSVKLTRRITKSELLKSGAKNE